MDINPGKIEKTGQLLFRDNGNFRFRQVEISEASLVEKVQGVVVKGWRHFFKLQFPFGGYKGIKAGMYTLSHERDIVYDPFNILSDSDKPEAITPMTGIFNRRGIKEVAQSKSYKHEHAKPPSNVIDKAVWALIGIVILFALGIFYQWMT